MAIAPRQLAVDLGEQEYGDQVVQQIERGIHPIRIVMPGRKKGAPNSEQGTIAESNPSTRGFYSTCRSLARGSNIKASFSRFLTASRPKGSDLDPLIFGLYEIV
jgi:hypothetical protein